MLNRITQWWKGLGADPEETFPEFLSTLDREAHRKQFTQELFWAMAAAGNIKAFNHPRVFLDFADEWYEALHG